MKSKLLLTALSTLLGSQVASAAGLSIFTKCKTLDLGKDSKTNLTLNMERKVNYDSSKATVAVSFQGDMLWDAEKFSAKGEFAADLPLEKGRRPTLPSEFDVVNGDESVSLRSVKATKSATPLVYEELAFKVQVYSGLFGTRAQYAVLKLALPDSKRSTVSAFGNLYITDKSESNVTTPDGGSQVSLVCESYISDN